MRGSVQLLGTRHNTDESLKRVESVIHERETDVVGVELPPCVFESDPDWSLLRAIDPKEPVTLPGLLMHSRLDGGLWQVDEMFVAARAAADVGADVALIDRPFAESLDAFVRAVVGDTGGWLQFLRDEIATYRESFSEGTAGDVLERDLWLLGERATPFVEYGCVLGRHGAHNPLNVEQREMAQEQADLEAVEAYLGVMGTLLPRLRATHIDERDAHMAGHLRWLGQEREDVLGVIAEGHVPGVSERIDGRRALDASLVKRPTYADSEAIPEEPPNSE